MTSTAFNKNKRIVKNTSFLYVRMFVVLLITLYISRVVLEVLGVVDFGVYNVVAGFVSMFAFLNASMSNAVQRFFNYDIGKDNGQNIKAIYTTSLYIQILIALFVLLLTETIGIWYMDNVMVIPPERINSAKIVFQISILSFLLVFMQVPYSAAVMTYEKMNYYAFVSIIDVVLKLICVVALKFIHSYDNLVLYGLFIMLIESLNFVLYAIYAKKNFLSLKFQKGFDKSLFKRMISFASWNIFGSFAYIIKGQGLNMLLNVFFGPVVNAARGISYQVSNALQGFSTNIFTAFRPQLMQSYSGQNYQRTTHLMFSMSKITYYLMLMLAVPVILEINYILKLWLGKNVPPQTGLFTVLIVLNMLVTNFNTPISQVVHATGEMKKYQLTTSIILTAILPLSWIILRLGAPAESVYWISLIISIINQCVCLLVLKGIYNYYSIRCYVKEVIIPCILVSALVFPVSYLLHIFIPTSFLKLILIVLVNILVICTVVYCIGLSAVEKNMIKNIIAQHLNKESE